MAIDDNTSYELTGAQVKDLASKIKAKADSSSLATVATSGSYTDLINTPVQPTVYDGTLTIQQNGTTVNTFTANSATNKTVNIQTITAETVAPAEEVGAITTSMIADGAVTSAKIDFSGMVYSTRLPAQAFVTRNTAALSLTLPAGKWKVTTEIRGFFAQSQDTAGGISHCGTVTTIGITQVGNTARPHETFVDIVEPSAQTTYSVSADFDMTWSIETKIIAERIG